MYRLLNNAQVQCSVWLPSQLMLMPLPQLVVSKLTFQLHLLSFPFCLPLPIRKLQEYRLNYEQNLDNTFYIDCCSCVYIKLKIQKINENDIKYSNWYKTLLKKSSGRISFIVQRSNWYKTLLKKSSGRISFIVQRKWMSTG